MERWVAVREGSSSREVPLSPSSPKPPPQASLLLRPPISRWAKAALPLPWLGRTLLLGGAGGVVGARRWRPSGLGRPRPGSVPSVGRRAQSWTVFSDMLRGWGQTPRMLGPGSRLAAAAWPPGGVSGRLGGRFGPAPPPPRPRPEQAPPRVARLGRSRLGIDAGTCSARL